MRLIADWRAELNRLWVTRGVAFTLYVSLADQILAAFQMQMPPWVYALCAGLLLTLRLLDQAKAAPAAPVAASSAAPPTP